MTDGKFGDLVSLLGGAHHLEHELNRMECEAKRIIAHADHPSPEKDRVRKEQGIASAHRTLSLIAQLREALPRGNVHEVAMKAIRLGQELRQGELSVTWHDDRLTGSATRAGGRKGAEIVHGPPHERMERRQDILDTYATELRKCGGAKMRAYAATAKAIGVSRRTVEAVVAENLKSKDS